MSLAGPRHIRRAPPALHAAGDALDARLADLGQLTDDERATFLTVAGPSRPPPHPENQPRLAVENAFLTWRQ